MKDAYKSKSQSETQMQTSEDGQEYEEERESSEGSHYYLLPSLVHLMYSMKTVRIGPFWQLTVNKRI